MFTVDVEDGKPPLKLPYNRSEDPWQVAYNFIQRHDLPSNYLDMVANHIIQNAGPQICANKNEESFSDPFTGNNRYIPTNETGDMIGIEFPSLDFITLKSISLSPLICK